MNIYIRKAIAVVVMLATVALAPPVAGQDTQVRIAPYEVIGFIEDWTSTAPKPDCFRDNAVSAEPIPTDSPDTTCSVAIRNLENIAPYSFAEHCEEACPREVTVYTSYSPSYLEEAQAIQMGTEAFVCTGSPPPDAPDFSSSPVDSSQRLCSAGALPVSNCVTAD